MSHCMGVLCGICRDELVSDERCPERGCAGRHGWTLEFKNDWARKTWPDHECFKR